MAISHIPKSVGHNFTPEYQISAIPYVRGVSGGSPAAIKDYDNDSPLTVKNSGNTNQTIHVVEFPKITQWIQFKEGAALTVYFCGEDAANKKNGILLSTTRTNPLHLRCVNLYFHEDDKNKGLQIVAGLTTIDRKEFVDVVETFLEANN